MIMFEKNQNIIKKIDEILKNRIVFITLLVIGFGMRFLVSIRGHNFDFDSYLIVSNIFNNGQNIYANTSRYNYGPIWFLILGFLYSLSAHNQEIFRMLLIFSLSLVDLGIFLYLKKNIGNITAFLFFLNPISIIITGYHNQFDNLSILLGLMSLRFFDFESNKSLSLRNVIGMILIGISITTKHILFLFPFWLSVKSKRVLNKFLIILIPTVIFLISFIPFWGMGKSGIIRNVFLYESFNNEPFYSLFLPKIFQNIFSSNALWIFLLVIFSFIFRERSKFESFIYYLAILVAASPAIANQYLAIVMPFVIVKINFFTIIYVLIGTWHLLVDQAGLHIYTLQQILNLSRIDYYYFSVTFLTLGIAFSVWRKDIENFIVWFIQEFKIWLGIVEK